MPLLCGSSADAEYATEVRERLQSAAPEAVILPDFLGAEALGAIFRQTAVNFHPCMYDAYGMSVVEAAAFGAPSIVNGEGAIGATALLSPRAAQGKSICINDAGAAVMPGCFEEEFAAPIERLAARLLDHVDDVARLNQVASTARARALGWSEAAAGAVLHRELAHVV